MRQPDGLFGDAARAGSPLRAALSDGLLPGIEALRGVSLENEAPALSPPPQRPPQPAPHQHRPLRATASALIITLPPTGSRRAHVLHHAGAHDRPRRRARRREAALRFTCSSSPRTRRVTPRRVISRRQELRAEGDRGVLDEREGRRLAGHAQAAPVQDPRPKHQLARPLRGVLRKAAPTPRRRNLAAGRRHGRAAPAAARARREAQAPSRAGARRGRRRQAQASAGLRRRISATGLTRRRTDPP